MGGRRGPVPKSPSTRARTNAAPGGERFYDPTPVKPRHMPPSPTGGYNRPAMKHWHAVMSGGWTVLMDEADNANADTWILVVHRLHAALADPGASAASIAGLSQEERRMRASFGGDLASRQRRHWWPLEAAPEGTRARLASVSTFPVDGMRMADFAKLDEEAGRAN